MPSRIAEARDSRRFADRGDLARALHQAQPIEQRIEIHDLRPRRDRLDLLLEHQLPSTCGRPTDPVPTRARNRARDRWRRRRPTRAGTARRSSGPRRPAFDDGVEGRPIRDVLDARHLARFLVGSEQRSFRVLEARVWRQEQRRGLGAAVDEQDRARHFDAAEIEELLVLLELLVVGPIGGARHDRHAVADPRHQRRPVRRKFRGRIDVGEQRLVSGDGSRDQERPEYCSDHQLLQCHEALRRSAKVGDVDGP